MLKAEDYRTADDYIESVKECFSANINTWINNINTERGAITRITNKLGVSNNFLWSIQKDISRKHNRMLALSTYTSIVSNFRLHPVLFLIGEDREMYTEYDYYIRPDDHKEITNIVLSRLRTLRENNRIPYTHMCSMTGITKQVLYAIVGRNYKLSVLNLLRMSYAGFVDLEELFTSLHSKTPDGELSLKEIVINREPPKQLTNLGNHLTEDDIYLVIANRLGHTKSYIRHIIESYRELSTL